MSEFLMLLCAFLAIEMNAQNDKMNDSINNLDEVVITATKTVRSLNSISVPTTVISGVEIEKTGITNLQNLLTEVTGLDIVNDHGSGVQIQGLNSDYILILIDGEPLVGRVSGTLDLDRIKIGDVEQIEVIKGPSSSLYGSEALAGVVNIITKNNKKSGVSIFGKYGTNNEWNASVDGALVLDKFTAKAFFNNYKTDGYSLEDVRVVGPHNNQTYRTKLKYEFSEGNSIVLNTRYFEENAEDNYLFEEEKYYSKSKVSDFTINPKFNFKIGNSLTNLLKFNYTKYKTEEIEELVETNENTYDSFYDEGLKQVELQSNYEINEKHHIIFGAGYISESVSTSRLSDTETHTASNKYGLINYEWDISKKANIVLGARVDKHDLFTLQFNPKLSGYYKVSPKLSFNASIGTGFKKPTFQQLYLNFSNPSVGYTVFGTTYVVEGMEQLINSGEIRVDDYTNEPILYDDYYKIADNAGKINPETSRGINVGFKAKPFDRVSVTGNLFRNDVDNLIESSAIALKENGSFVYSYVNLYEIYTQGITLDAKYHLNNTIQFSFGYQYLDAKDKQVKKEFENGERYAKDENGVSYKLSSSDYGGLFNRSKHSANFKLTVNDIVYGIANNTRLMYKGKYGYADLNGSGALDDASEYIDGYFLLNTNFTKSFLDKKLILNVGAENLLNQTNSSITSLQGRIIYTSINFKF